MRYTTSSVGVTNFTLAVSRKYNKDETDFISIVAFKKTAELICEYVEKGDLLGIEGRIQTRNYEGQDGKRVYVTEVVADQVHFLTPKKKEEQPQKTNSEIIKDVMEDKNPYAEFGNSIEISDDSLPF